MSTAFPSLFYLVCWSLYFPFFFFRKKKIMSIHPTICIFIYFNYMHVLLYYYIMYIMKHTWKKWELEGWDKNKWKLKSPWLFFQHPMNHYEHTLGCKHPHLETTILCVGIQGPSPGWVDRKSRIVKTKNCSKFHLFSFFIVCWPKAESISISDNSFSFNI